MEGVTTAIVLFIFACIIYPTLVKFRAQFYAAIGIVILIILFDALGRMFIVTSPKFNVFTYVACAVLQVTAIIMLFTSCGGITPREFGGEMLNAIEVIRRGEDTKEVIIPLSGHKGKRPDAAPVASDEAGREVFTIDDEDLNVSLRKPMPPKAEIPKDTSPIPLERPPLNPPRA